jgi:succinate dehydrogenase flavin-adding protein (antitoxin of CptAB toxin-antitoxin module)
MTDKNDHIENDVEEESVIINPKEVEEKRKRQPRGLTTNIQDAVVAENRAGRVQVNLESKGRFGSPETMYFTDFMVGHVTDLSVSNPEDLTETVITILNDIKNKDCDFDLINLTLEELLEVLIAIKLQFNTSQHTHRWMCDCQYNVPDEVKQWSEATIDLKSIHYRSIEEVDKVLQERYREKFNALSDEGWKEYLDFRYGTDSDIDFKTWTKEQEIETLKVKEPFNYIHPVTRNIYSFRLMRVSDIVQAKRMARAKWNDKIVAVKNRPTPVGSAIAKAKADKELEIKELQKLEAKDAINFTNAMTLIGFNGEELVKPETRIIKYMELTRNDQFKFSDFLKDIEFGIYDERDFVCNLCGKTERRVLQQDTTPIELLPLDVNTAREQRQRAKLDFYFAV